MKKTKKYLALSLLATVIVLLMVSCPNGTGGGRKTNPKTTPTKSSDDDFAAVTNFSQLNGTWKYSITETQTAAGVTAKATIDITLIINATAKTSSSIIKETYEYSGPNADAAWPAIKDEHEADGYTCNDSTKTATLTETEGPNTLTDPQIANIVSETQINKSGNKIRFKVTDFGFVVFTKQ